MQEGEEKVNTQAGSYMFFSPELTISK